VKYSLRDVVKHNSHESRIFLPLLPLSVLAGVFTRSFYRQNDKITVLVIKFWFSCICQYLCLL